MQRVAFSGGAAPLQGIQPGAEPEWLTGGFDCAPILELAGGHVLTRGSFFSPLAPFFYPPPKFLFAACRAAWFDKASRGTMAVQSHWQTVEVLS